MDDLDFAMLDPDPVEVEVETLPPPPRFADLPDGIHAVPDEVYHQRELGQVSASGLKLLARTPSHYRAWALGEMRDLDDSALAFGKAAHAAVLEPEVFDASYAPERTFGDCRKRENKARRDAWRASVYGKAILSADDAQRIDGIRRSIAAHPLASALLRGGRPEVAALWTDEETGLRCKGKADYWRPDLGVLVDLKTSSDAMPDAFGRSAATYRYHVQAALYREGWRALGHAVDHFIFVVVEKLPPYAVALFEMDAEAMETGRIIIRREMAVLAECVRTGEWPGYSARIEELKLPKWAL